jgi:hypothetical protein
MNISGYCIFIDTICEGRILAWHDERGLPVVYPTPEAAQREIADDMIEYSSRFWRAFGECQNSSKKRLRSILRLILYALLAARKVVRTACLQTDN